MSACQRGVDPDLIGGVRIKVGDDVIDASVRGKLQSNGGKPQKLGEIMRLNPTEISRADSREDSELAVEHRSAHHGHRGVGD